MKRAPSPVTIKVGLPDKIVARISTISGQIGIETPILVKYVLAICLDSMSESDLKERIQLLIDADAE